MGNNITPKRAKKVFNKLKETLFAHEMESLSTAVLVITVIITPSDDAHRIESAYLSAREIHWPCWFHRVQGHPANFSVNVV